MSNKITFNRGFPLFFKKEINEDGTRTVFGCYPDNNVVKGDELIIPADNGTYMVESVKRRDVVGNYSPDVNKENAHFEAICNYTPQAK
jgi:uncharacterized protein YjlB